MYKILKKIMLNSATVRLDIEAPLIATKAKAGQFVIVRLKEGGERIPLTIADCDSKSITIIFQVVGKTTFMLGKLCETDSIMDVVGPLGTPSSFDNVKFAAVVSGGSASAVSLPQLKLLKNSGAQVDSVCGFRNKELIILEHEIASASSNFHIVTNDGSRGSKGVVTDKLKELIENGNKYDLIFTAGPLAMMRAVCDLTKNYGIKTLVSMNSTMIDGTGMCGCCRVNVGGEIKFACIDGPDFDGHLVDFGLAINRSKMFNRYEQLAFRKHRCNLGECCDV